MKQKVSKSALLAVCLGVHRVTNLAKFQDQIKLLSWWLFFPLCPHFLPLSHLFSLASNVDGIHGYLFRCPQGSRLSKMSGSIHLQSPLLGWWLLFCSSLSPLLLFCFSLNFKKNFLIYFFSHASPD